MNFPYRQPWAISEANSTSHSWLFDTCSLPFRAANPRIIRWSKCPPHTLKLLELACTQDHLLRPFQVTRHRWVRWHSSSPIPIGTTDSETDGYLGRPLRWAAQVEVPIGWSNHPKLLRVETHFADQDRVNENLHPSLHFSRPRQILTDTQHNFIFEEQGRGYYVYNETSSDVFKIKENSLEDILDEVAKIDSGRNWLTD